MIVSAITAGTARKFQSAHKMTFGSVEKTRVDFGKGTARVAVGGSGSYAYPNPSPEGERILKPNIPPEMGLKDFGGLLVDKLVGQSAWEIGNTGNVAQILLPTATLEQGVQGVVNPPNLKHWAAEAAKIEGLSVREIPNPADPQNPIKIIDGLPTWFQGLIKERGYEANVQLVNDLYAYIWGLSDPRVQATKQEFYKKQGLNGLTLREMLVLTGGGTNIAIDGENHELGHLLVPWALFENTVYPELADKGLLDLDITELEHIAAMGKRPGEGKPGEYPDGSHGTQRLNDYLRTINPHHEAISFEKAEAKANEGDQNVRNVLTDQIGVLTKMLKHISEYTGETPLTAVSETGLTAQKGSTPVVWGVRTGGFGGLLNAKVGDNATGKDLMNNLLRNAGMKGIFIVDDLVRAAGLEYSRDLGPYVLK